MASPHKGSNWINAGIREVFNIADAVAFTGLNLDSLAIIGATHRIWERQIRSTEQVSRLKNLVRPLRRLRLSVRAEPDDEELEEEDTSDRAGTEAQGTFETGLFTEVLAEASSLRVLQLRLWSYTTFDEEFLICPLENALGQLHFPHLYELVIGQCSTTSEYLQSVVLRHKASLRRLTLTDMHLIPDIDDWPEFFEAISCQLPTLRQIRLRGEFHAWGQLSFDFDIPGAESPKVFPWRDSVENFVLKGGEVDWEHFYAEEERYDRSEGDGYEPPGLPADNTEPDDPVLDYHPDEFDYMA